MSGGQDPASHKVTIGSGASPTPVGRFAVTDKLRGADFGSYYGCCILAISGGSRTFRPAGGRGPARDPRRPRVGDRRQAVGRLPPRRRAGPALADAPRPARDAGHDPPLSPRMQLEIRPRVVLLGLTVGIVLADSSVVTLALPTILAQYDVEIATLAWVLASYNLALALAAVPAAFAARRWPAEVYGAATVLFSAASLACAFAPSIEVLIGARAVQGVAGAAVVCAALDLLTDAAGGDAPAARVWALSGILGAALGPAAGGFLTQLLGWESIFVVQAPVMLAALAVLRGAHPARVKEHVGRPHVAANLALLVISGALVGSSFLLVLLLINGWRLEPLEAGLVVTVLPSPRSRALASAAASRRCGPAPPRARS